MFWNVFSCFFFWGLEVYGFPGDNDKKYDLYASRYHLYHENLDDYVPQDYYIIPSYKRNMEVYSKKDGKELIFLTEEEEKTFLENSKVTITEVETYNRNYDFYYTKGRKKKEKKRVSKKWVDVVNKWK